MRALFWTSTSLMIAAAAACASSDEEKGSTLPPVPDSGAPLASDDGGDDTPDAKDAAADGQLDGGAGCSAAGWCPTSLPDNDLTLKDIWTMPGHAFAVAESPTLGCKALEWTESTGKWSYIDDGTQNQPGSTQYVGRLWAPSEDEVYFTISPRTVFHGKRSSNANKPWAWTHQQLENRIPADYPPQPLNAEHYTGRPMDLATATKLVSLGVFGTSASDVYAWYGNAIYRMSSGDDGNPTWAVDYVADDLDRADEQLFFLGATATSSNDVWFGGARTGKVYEYRSCAMAVHKTAAGYQRAVDGVGNSSGCEPRPDSGAVVVGGASGWFTDMRSVSPNSIIGLKGGQTVVRISGTGDTYSVDLSQIPLLAPQASKQFMFLSISAAPDDTLWLGGFGLVAQAKNVWDGDAGSYRVSTIALNGSFTNMTVYQIRASSNADVWAVGDRNALHKTTP